MKNTIFTLLITACLVIFPSQFVVKNAHGGEKLNFMARYNAEWLGVLVGKAVLEISEQEGGYKATFHIKSKGLAKKVTKYWSENTAIGKFIAGKRAPEKYTSLYRMKKKKKTVTVTYGGKDGKQTDSTITPPEREGKRKKTSQTDRYGTFDPIVAGLIVREKLLELKAQGGLDDAKFTVPCFDGKRRYDIVSSVLGRFRNKDTGKEVIKLKVLRKPISGFSGGEKKRMKDQEPVITFMVPVEKMLPELALAEAPIGKAKARFVGYCKTLKQCWNM